MTTLNLQVGEGFGDADQRIDTGGMASNGENIQFGSRIVGKEVGLRFPGVSGLSGVTIDGATLTFQAYMSDSDAFTGDWYAEDILAPPAFVNIDYNISNRTKTTATCEGDGSDFGDWTIGSNYTFTGDGVNTIADIIQELADSYDPAAIVLIHQHTSGSGEREARTYEYSPSVAPKLDIDYTAAAPAVDEFGAVGEAVGAMHIRRARIVSY